MRAEVITLTRGDGYERLCVHMPAIWKKAVTVGGSLFACKASWIGEKVVEWEKLPNRKLKRSKQVGEKVVEWEKLPNRKLRESKQVGEKVVERGKLPNRKLKRSKQVG